MTRSLPWSTLMVLEMLTGNVRKGSGIKNTEPDRCSVWRKRLGNPDYCRMVPNSAAGYHSHSCTKKKGGREEIEPRSIPKRIMKTAISEEKEISWDHQFVERGKHAHLYVLLVAE